MNNVTVIDRGWTQIKTRVRSMDGRSVKVGIFGGQSGGGGDGVAVVDYAIFNELGTSNIPARPFLRTAADQQSANVAKRGGAVAQAVMAGRMSVDAALGDLGAWFADRVAATIRASKGWAAPLAPSTIARKGSSVPLINQARLVNAIRHEVE